MLDNTGCYLRPGICQLTYRHLHLHLHSETFLCLYTALHSYSLYHALCEGGWLVDVGPGTAVQTGRVAQVLQQKTMLLLLQALKVNAYPTGKNGFNSNLNHSRTKFDLNLL